MGWRNNKVPIYEYECPNGHQFDYIIKAGAGFAPNEMPCQIRGCVLEAEKQWSAFNTLADSKSTVYFENPQTREVRLGASDYDTNPIGFERKEAKGLGGRLKLEKDLQKQESEKQKGQHYAEVLTKNVLTKKRHDNIKANFNTVHKIIDEDTGRQTGTYTYDEGTKALMKKAMERSNKSTPRFREKQMIFDVNHKDKSNREGKD